MVQRSAATALGDLDRFEVFVGQRLSNQCPRQAGALVYGRADKPKGVPLGFRGAEQSQPGGTEREDDGAAHARPVVFEER